MGKSTLIGLIIGFGALIIGFSLDGGNIGALALLSPAVIVFGGTIGAITVSFSLKDVASIPKLIKEAMTEPPINLQATLDKVVELATTVKRQGLLSLEEVIHKQEFIDNNDPLMTRGLSLLIDGLDKDLFKDVLQNELYFFDQKKKRDISIFEQAGGFSPTLGIIGTVLGLIQVLGDISSPEELAASIAIAFVATLYGVCFANLVYIPVANKLKLRLKAMKLEKEMIIEGILSINDCESPIVIKEKLRPFLEMQEPSGKKAAAEAPTYNTVKKETEA